MHNASISGRYVFSHKIIAWSIRADFALEHSLEIAELTTNSTIESLGRPTLAHG